MNLPQEAIQEFKKLYFHKYGRELSFEDASQMGKELMSLYQLSKQNNINYE